jgi:dCTP deaminase
MTFWSGETIAREVPNLITPFEQGQIDCAAYTLRVGAEVYISPSSTADARSASTRKLQPRETFIIPPGQFAFLLTEERVKVPNHAIGLISMKAKIKFRGLVNISGFHVDPGYDGHLVFSVFNAGPSSVHLSRGDNCFLIWYANLDMVSKEVRNKPGFDSIPSELINPISGEVISLAYLSNRLEKIENQHSRLMWLGGVLLAASLGLLGKSCSDIVAGRPTASGQPTVTQIMNVPPAPSSCSPAPASTMPAVKAPTKPKDSQTTHPCH